MAAPKVARAFEIGAVAVGVVFALIAVLPLVPLLIEFVVGIVAGVLDVILPGGDSSIVE